MKIEDRREVCEDVRMRRCRRLMKMWKMDEDVEDG